MEDVLWKPPHLTFTIERHGGIMSGGTRATLDNYDYDLSTDVMSMKQYGHRQLKKAAAPLKTKPLAQETARRILRGAKHDSLKWMEPGKRVQVRAKLIVPQAGYKQTNIGRERRFKDDLVSVLAAKGWHRVTSNNRFEFERRP